LRRRKQLKLPHKSILPEPRPPLSELEHARIRRKRNTGTGQIDVLFYRRPRGQGRWKNDYQLDERHATIAWFRQRRTGVPEAVGQTDSITGGRARDARTAS
jgi:hypothetical protein